MKQLLVIFFMLIGTSSFAQNESLIQKLQANDVLEITRTSQGCFSSSTETIVIQKNENQLMSSFSGLDSKQNQIKLSNNQLNAFLDFEQKLSLLENQIGFCTSTDTYTVKLNGKLLTTNIDSSCSGWSGFADLKNNFFSVN